MTTSFFRRFVHLRRSAHLPVDTSPSIDDIILAERKQRLHHYDPLGAILANLRSLPPLREDPPWIPHHSVNLRSLPPLYYWHTSTEIAFCAIQRAKSRKPRPRSM